MNEMPSSSHVPAAHRRWILAAAPLVVGLALLLGVPLPTAGQDAETPGAIPFSHYELDNGLDVILAPDPEATAVAVNLWYRVGSRNERPGRSGFAHLFEHLMFQGSDHVEPGEHATLVERAGGNLNASVTEDRTNYYQTLPPERMNLGLWLEAERMRSLAITAENMAREVEVVKEERRLRIDNAPYGTSQLQAGFYAAYDSASCFPYAHSVIGSMEDLDAAELPDVEEFFQLYYAPNNATLTVVGAFDETEARALIREYFGSVPGGAEPSEPDCRDPFSHLPVEREVRDPNATLLAVWLSYGIVERSHPDAPALQVLAQILGTGESSRFHRRLVREEQAALQTGTSATARLGPGVLQMVAIANQGVEARRLLELLDEEIQRMRDEGPTPEELERARNQVRASTILERQSVMGRAEALQSANQFLGSPEAVDTTVERIAAVSADDVQRAARTYLTPENRAVIFTRPGSETNPDMEEDR
ncbi:MAG: M16 family metallopeptidase [Gemmatimonadota bacterium]